MPISSLAVANCFLDLAEEAEKAVTPMKIQKLVYFAHGWHLALKGEPLVDEHPEAWQFGPVFPDLYHHFKEFGSGPIKRRAYGHESSSKGGVFKFRLTTPSLDELKDETDIQFAKNVVRRVWEVYGSWTGVQLSHFTHVPGGPWDVTWQANSDRKGTDIPDNLIRIYFASKVEQSSKAS